MWSITSCMALKFLSKRPITTECDHESQIRIEVAGMSREVCESCGRVSVGYVEAHFRPGRLQEVEEAIRSVRSRSKD